MILGFQKLLILLAMQKACNVIHKNEFKTGLYLAVTCDLHAVNALINKHKNPKRYFAKHAMALKMNK